jgi:hypothetical protein
VNPPEVRARLAPEIRAHLTQEASRTTPVAETKPANILYDYKTQKFMAPEAGASGTKGREVPVGGIASNGKIATFTNNGHYAESFARTTTAANYSGGGNSGSHSFAVIPPETPPVDPIRILRAVAEEAADTPSVHMARRVPALRELPAAVALTKLIESPKRKGMCRNAGACDHMPRSFLYFVPTRD